LAWARAGNVSREKPKANERLRSNLQPSDMRLTKMKAAIGASAWALVVLPLEFSVFERLAIGTA